MENMSLTGLVTSLLLPEYLLCPDVRDHECKAAAKNIFAFSRIVSWDRKIKVTITFLILLMVFFAGGYCLTFTALNPPRIVGMIEASENPCLRAVWFLENICLFLYTSAIAEIVFHNSRRLWTSQALEQDH
jgi:hypothetical protein